MWKDVLSNVLYFMQELLPAAASKGQWDISGVDKAVSWALYCEKTVDHARKNGSLQLAFGQIAAKYNWVLTFSELRNARRLLFQYWMQNQLLESSVRQHVEELVQNSLGSTTLADIHLQILQQEEAYRHIIADLKKPQHRVISMKLKTLLLFEARKSLDNKNISKHFGNIAEQQDGLDILCEIAVSENVQFSCDYTECNGVYIIKWLEKLLMSPEKNRSEKLISKLCNLSPQLLCNLLDKNPTLLDIMLTRLQTECRKMIPNSADGVCVWLPGETSYLEYQDVLKMYCAFQLNENLARYVGDKVLEWRLEDGGSAWSDVIKDANKTLCREL